MTVKDYALRFYQNYDALKQEHGVKDVDVSRATGVSSTTLSEWKKGLYLPSVLKLKPIADFFGVSLDELVKE